MSARNTACVVLLALLYGCAAAPSVPAPPVSDPPTRAEIEQPEADSSAIATATLIIAGGKEPDIIMVFRPDLQPQEEVLTRLIITEEVHIMDSDGAIGTDTTIMSIGKTWR